MSKTKQEKVKNQSFLSGGGGAGNRNILVDWFPSVPDENHEISLPQNPLKCSPRGGGEEDVRVATLYAVSCFW